jgi:glycosyltransferase involved in cell wall biosynthesis
MSQKSRPLVSVVTPSLNQGRFIERTLLSVLCQDYAEVEFIVVDGLSTDGTGAVLERYSDDMSVVVRERDAGLADALHKGFARASGDILAYLNADDCYAGPGVIGRAVACLETLPRAEVVFGRRIVIDEQGRFVSRWPFLPYDAETLRQVDFIPQECCFWRRSVWERAGSFIDRSLRFAVDYDLWLRFQDCGGRFVAVNETFGFFREHHDQKSQTRWQEEGWPEVRRLQERIGVTRVESDLKNVFDRHAFGVGFQRQLRRVWHALGDRHVSRATRGRPLDAWMNGKPVPARRGSALSA